MIVGVVGEELLYLGAGLLMDAKAKSFTFLANEGQVTIPFFQRGYVWKEDNWSDLLSDLFAANRRHFLGSLILKQQQAGTGEPKNVMVIDGQQRLTTLSILLKAIFDSLPAETQTNCKESVRTHLFFKRYPTDRDYRVRIKHSHVDSEAYTAVIVAGLDADPIEKTGEAPNRVIQCYRYFSEELAKRPLDAVVDLFNRLLHPDEKLLVVIDLDEKDDEQAIYDATNTAGVRLSGSDIIKNALFQRLIQLQGNQGQEAIELYERTWKRVFLLDDETVEFWEKEKLTGRIKRDNAEILLHALAVIKGFYDPDKHLLSDLSALYKAHIGLLSSAGDLAAFIEEIARYAVLFRQRIPDFSDNLLLSYEDCSLRLFHILDVLQISTFHPFIMSVIHEHRNDEEKCAAILGQLERFVIRRILAQQETKNFNKLARDFITNSAALTKEAERTSDEQVLAGLKSITNKNAALALFWVELYRRNNDAKFDVKELKYDYSLEHILPQKWEQHWRDLPEKRDATGAVLSVENSKKDRYEKVYWLGNMTLLTGSLNSSLKNYAFEKKIAGDGRKKGVKAYASLSITRHDIVDPFDRGERIWDEARIEKRTYALAQELLEFWGSAPGR